MFDLSIKSIWYVLIRDYMSFKKLFKISIFPNLVNPLIYLLAFGLGLSKLVGSVYGVPYFVFVASGLVAATAMSAATAETTTNAYIQMKVEKTYEAIAMTPVNLQDIVAGQIIWAGIRSVIFGSLFLIIVAVLGVMHTWLVLFIPFVLFITGIVFGTMGLIFTLLIPNRDYINYYQVLVIQPLYMFSATFFPLSVFPKGLRIISNISPLYHSAIICRALLAGNIDFYSLSFHFMVLLLMILVLFFIPVRLVQKKMRK
ncbi:ABC transporter permease [Lactococcus allomyrinae]|uniref:Transport permease protein n=1 Tax=Lactococcus allomyrinae TaxID=2419773 RepID=A0A387BJG4_9LACT|nr:ABC transporter permease [Lactococcus allomyrinae]AYG01070.1 ABC transporter permease [Lactococcus allomyrinae]